MRPRSSRNYAKIKRIERRSLPKDLRKFWAGFLRNIRNSSPLFYGSSLKEVEKGLSFHLGRHIVELAKKSRRPPNVIDLGCGLPYALHELEEYALKKGIKVSLTGLSAEKPRPVKRESKILLRAIPFHRLSEKIHPNSQDIVFSHYGFANVLQFGGIEYARQTLREVKKILKPEGLFVFNVPLERVMHGQIVKPVKNSFQELKELGILAGLGFVDAKNFEQTVSTPNNSGPAGEFEESKISGIAFVFKKPKKIQNAFNKNSK